MKKSMLGFACVAMTIAATAVDVPRGRVMFWYDTEDYVTPEAPDAALFHAKLLSEFGFRGNFNIVGFYAQRLAELGRQDVIDALKSHCLGSQTLYHSRHPTICEYTDLADWDAAYHRCLMEESQCVGMLRATFGRDSIPLFCPPGTSVTPVAMYVYADMGVTVYGGGIDVFGVRNFDRLAWYCNMLHIPYAHCFGTKTDDGAINDELASRHLTVIATHPCNIITESFWDAVNYCGGNLCEWRKWKAPPLLSAERQAAARQAWRDLMTRIKNDPRLTVVTADDLVRGVKPRVRISRADVPALRAKMEAGLEPVEAPASWCVSDVFQASVAFLRGEDSFLPAKAWGFLEKPVGVEEPTTLKRADMVVAARALKTDGFVPPRIAIGGTEIGPADFLIAALELLDSGADAVTVTPREQIGPIGEHLKNLPTWRFSPENWRIYSPDLRDVYLSDRLRWQFWTLRYEE